MNAAFPLRRRPEALSQPFDVLIVGGGIYGAWLAYDAAQRGLSVALIEKRDWGSGTSSASSKLIHGGLRYLEHYEFSLVRHALAERRVLSQIAPHLVRPLTFALPIYENARAGMLKLGAGLTLYDLLATGAQPVARHRKLSAKALRAYYPFLRQEGLVGGFTYGDCQEDDARMTLAVVAAAQAAGAVCVNRMQATQLRRDGQEVLGVETLDELTHHAGVISARHTIMAAGPWLSDLLGEAAPKVKLIKGVHLLMPAIPDNDEAFLLTAPQDGRVFFVIPWYGKTLVGTTESRVNHVDEAQVLPEDVDYLLAAANANLPGLDWRKDQVLSAFAGVRTLQDDSQNGQGSLSATSREFDVVQPYQNLLVLLGGKYTTSRVDAAKVIDQLYKLRDQPVVPSRTHAVPLPDAPPWQHFDDWLAHEIQQLQALGVESEAARWVALRHGTRTHRVAEIIQENPTWAARIHPEAPFIRAEALVAVRDEMAMNPDDVFRRRMPLSLLVADLHLVRGQMEPLLTLAWTRQSWGLAGA